QMLNALFKMPLAGWLIFLSAAGSLAFAFTMQYGFDVEPCVLCLWQRVPFAVAACLALTAALWKPYGHFTKIILIM
ncbi:disulfide bond formation protein B, partial [Klebsiella pneumoniae]|uniref:disulfide bond formation protein B n=1 Tax=Klebsiella pneumoniae TaxID=573 RepID=UPI003EE2523A